MHGLHDFGDGKRAGIGCMPDRCLACRRHDRSERGEREPSAAHGAPDAHAQRAARCRQTQSPNLCGQRPVSTTQTAEPASKQACRSSKPPAARATRDSRAPAAAPRRYPRATPAPSRSARAIRVQTPSRSIATRSSARRRARTRTRCRQARRLRNREPERVAVHGRPRKINSEMNVIGARYEKDHRDKLSTTRNVQNRQRFAAKSSRRRVQRARNETP